MSNNQDNLDDIFAYIKARRDEGQGAPTQREIASHCDLSPTTVSRCLSMLEAQGRISRQAFKSRSIRIVDQLDEQQDNETAESVYRYLQEELQWGDIPSQREIAQACYISEAEVRRALLWLEAQGRIERVSGQRNIRLVAS